MRDVITKYHPKFVTSNDLRQTGLSCPTYFNMEFLTEEALAAVGGYQFVDQAGYDFSDLSDSKTTTVNHNTGVVEITGVENKIGSLRITAFNPFKETVDYFFVPRSKLDLVREPCYGKNNHKQRVRFSYSKNYQDSYGWFDIYRVNDFVQLATLKG